ncbi:NAD(P)/FAD-dependent oxidoreductase [Foetidibacter luteolus]|uniref:NAD(P)/FAD-dependent oxidoreductase n=1 Tax=Foetidibacter luteolus TaxID=2608880 RepID=UPI00129C033F|nr:NAD(P)/FAD-dependent oxidoreductase [Foetidibacter luteolus]
MDEQAKYDVAVIGGGLAGLTLAIQCADAGYTVALFEKEVYPFHKVCGEYISFESHDFLLRLGVNLHELQLPAISRLQISDIKGNLYQFRLPLGGFGISRYKLDDLLYYLAVQKGVQVFTGNKVQDVQFVSDGFVLQHANGITKASVAAGAYGKRANLDIKKNRLFALKKNNKLNNYIAVKYHISTSHPVNSIALHNFDNGYCGLSKIEDDRYCLCYLATAQHLKNNNNSISEMEKQVLFQNPHLKKIFSTASFLYQEPLTISQVSFDVKTQVENHLLMLGDAAGMITPLCGNGMSMAMHGSKLAFESIDAFLRQQITREQMEHRYERNWNRQFSRRLWMGRTVQRLFGNTSSILFLRTMGALPFLARQVIKQTHGKPF